jgi:hypothetical protein
MFASAPFIGPPMLEPGGWMTGRSTLLIIYYCLGVISIRHDPLARIGNYVDGVTGRLGSDQAAGARNPIATFF